jgi:metallo-beta-lactamase family protein
MLPGITFLGAAQEVTGSSHLLCTGTSKILLDCGLFQGGRDAQRSNEQDFPFYPSNIDAVILSHAHLDHSGRLPKLVADGFTGPIHCTPQTWELLPIMLRDAASLQARDIEWENKRRRRAGKPLIRPPYEEEHVHQAIAQCRPHSYGMGITVTSDIEATLFDAGHILGSASIHLDIQHPERPRRLIYSGDLGNPQSLLMHDPQVPAAADWVVMESTYGDREHQEMDNTREELARILQQAHGKNGNVLIPAFAVGRTQEVLYHLAILRQQRRMPQHRVYLDSPMAIEVSALYLNNISSLNRDDINLLTENNRHPIGEALGFIHPTHTTEESMALNRIEGGAIIIAGSGMCEGGRIRHHLKYNLWRREAHVVIVGYQARGTLGRRLVDGSDRVEILGADIAVNAQIHTLGGYSAHAGRRELITWASQIDGHPGFSLVHGETHAQQALADALKSHLNCHVEIPERGSSLSL